MPSDAFSFVDTLVLLGLRTALFLACQRIVLGALSHQLDDAASTAEESIPLEPLPSPSTAPRHASDAAKHGGVLRSAFSRIVFSVVFTESCMLFTLLMAQALDIFTPGSRLLHWKISLFILLLVLMLVIPVSLSLFTTSSYLFNCLPGPSRVLPLLIYFALLSYVPLPSGTDINTHAWLGPTFARLIVLGVVLLGVLSGYGSVTTAWGYFPFLCGPRQKAVTPARIENARESLTRVQDELARKREELAAHERRAQTDDAKQPSSWLSRMTPSSFSNGATAALATELTALGALERNIAADVERLQNRRAAAAFDRTCAGALFVLLRRAMGVYCILRGSTSLANLVLPRSPSTSTAPGGGYTDILASLLSLLPLSPAVQVRVPLILRQLNLVVVGLVIGSSLRRVLVALHVLRRERGRGTSAVGTLVLAQIMGIYFLSTLIQLRTSFPHADADRGDLFGTLPEYQLFGPVFDASFLGAGVVAAGAEWVRSKAAEDDDDDSGVGGMG